MEIKAVLLDLDGVLRHWNNQKLFDVEDSLNLVRGYLLKNAFESALLHRAITGLITHEQWMKEVIDKVSIEIGASSSEILMNAWIASDFTLDREIYNALKEQYPEAKFALLTNATDKLKEDLAGTFILEEFDYIFDSSEIGFAKPDRRIFEYALEKLGVRAGEVLYIDDSEGNVDVGKGMGLEVEMYKVPLETLA